LEVVVGEFYEQAGSLFVEAYDAFAFGGKDGVIGRQLVDRRFWVLRFRLMVKRGP
jgi:hypothetical protein